MPRQPRKQLVSQKDSEIPVKILSWVKNNYLNSLIFLLILIAFILYLTVIFKAPAKEPVAEPIKQTVTVDSISVLENQIEKQNSIINKLEIEISNLENMSKLQDKRLQAHTELLKRMCEYIVVITVDKKIIPRHCLPEYKWGKEENGN